MTDKEKVEYTDKVEERLIDWLGAGYPKHTLSMIIETDNGDLVRAKWLSLDREWDFLFEFRIIYNNIIPTTPLLETYLISGRSKGTPREYLEMKRRHTMYTMNNYKFYKDMEQASDYDMLHDVIAFQKDYIRVKNVLDNMTTKLNEAKAELNRTNDKVANFIRALKELES